MAQSDVWSEKCINSGAFSEADVRMDEETE